MASREANAQLLYNNRETWLTVRMPGGTDAYGIPSMTGEKVYYAVTRDTCSCPDFQHRHDKDGTLCKHVLAVRMVKRLPTANIVEVGIELYRLISSNGTNEPAFDFSHVGPAYWPTHWDDDNQTVKLTDYRFTMSVTDDEGEHQFIVTVSEKS